MRCPSCATWNLQGLDVCAECGQDLTAYDTPGRRDELEAWLMSEPVESLEPAAPILMPAEATLEEVVARLRDRDVGAVLIGTVDRVAGIFTERDLLLRAADRWDEVKDAAVAGLMTPSPEAIDAEAPISFALNRMEVGDFRHLPVMRAGRLCGTISVEDVVAYVARRHPDLMPAQARW